MHSPRVLQSLPPLSSDCVRASKQFPRRSWTRSQQGKPSPLCFSFSHDTPFLVDMPSASTRCVFPLCANAALTADDQSQSVLIVLATLLRSRLLQVLISAAGHTSQSSVCLGCYGMNPNDVDRDAPFFWEAVSGRAL
jgi:hypothetical protein